MGQWDQRRVHGESFLKVTLTTPYRSTKAITRLARFVSKQIGMFVPKGDWGCDIEGSLPRVFDVGRDKDKLLEALKECEYSLGDSVTMLVTSSAGRPKKWLL